MHHSLVKPVHVFSQLSVTRIQAGGLCLQGFSRGEQLTLLRNDLTSQEQQALAELVQRDGQGLPFITDRTQMFEGLMYRSLSV